MPNGFRPPSERASSDLGKNISAAMDYHPKAIIINVPSEDVAFGYSIAEQLNNYDALFAFAQEQRVPLWIASPQPRNFPSLGMRRQLSAVRDSLLHRYTGAHVIDFWTGIADSSGGIRPEYDSGDGIHLNNAGQGVLCQRVISTRVHAVLPK